VLIYVLSYKRHRLLDILGFVLTPVLLAALMILIVKGIATSPEMLPATDSRLSTFFSGLKDGYQTMDLLATYFFSSIIILCLRKELHSSDRKDFSKIIAMTLKACCIGATLLALVYTGASYLAAFNSESLVRVPTEELIGALAILHLGRFGGIVAIGAVVLACLTTAMALAAVFANYIHEELSLRKLSYHYSLILTLIISYLMSTLRFTGLMTLLTPILFICYPVLIVLTCSNLMYKLWGFPYIKTPVAITLATSVVLYFIN